MDKDYITENIGEFLWDGFTNPQSVGVRLEDVLDGAALVGLKLTDEQKSSVLAHSEAPDDWTEDDENVRDLIADATDSKDFDKMYKWLEYVVGDIAATELVEDWKEEA